MRVAQVISSLHPDGGGLPKTAAALASSLALQGVESCLIFFASPQSLSAARAAYHSFPGFDQVQIKTLPPGKLNILSPLAVWKALDDFSPGLIHTHGLWEPVLAHAQRYALHHHLPYVVFPQSMLHPWQSQKHRTAKWLLKNLLGWKSRWKRAAFIQVLSREEASHWQAEGIAHTRLITNGVFPGEDPGAGPALPEEWGGKPFLLSLARLHPQKSPDLLIQAFAQVADDVPDLQLVLAGPDYGMEKALKSQAAALGLTQRVHFPGTLRGQTKWSALHRCACFCLPSQAEGFSLAVLEAALAGAPMVISKGCYFPQLVEAGAALQAELHAGDWQQKIEEILARPEERNDAARELVLAGYSWEKIAGEMMSAYREAGA